MEILRIAKYLPDFYDENGAYKREEWTSVTDVGESFGGEYFTLSDYLATEAKYINVLKEFIKYSAPLDTFALVKIEKHSIGEQPIYTERQIEIFDKLGDADSLTFPISDLHNVLSLLLREDIWGEIHLRNINTVIHVGYDYYVYIESDTIPEFVLKLITLSGLYYKIMVK
jgi:hypothetical protein